MKKLLLLSVTALTIISCSQQQFAFRKKVNADRHQLETASSVKSSTKQIIKLDEIKSTEPTLEVELNKNVEIASTFASKQVTKAKNDKNEVEVGPINKDDITTQIATENPVKPNNKSEGKDEGATKDKSWASITGFITAIVGWLVFPFIFCTAGIVFSAIGLKSKKKGLAIAGLIIGIVGFILSLAIYSA